MVTEFSGPPPEVGAVPPEPVQQVEPVASVTNALKPRSKWTKLLPTQLPGHSHTCTYGKARHSWRHWSLPVGNSGYCSFKAHALCRTHRALFNKAWQYPNASQKAAQIALDEAHEASKARAQAFEDHLYQGHEEAEDPVDMAYRRMMLWLHNDIEKED